MSERPRIRPGQASPGWVAGAQRGPREGDRHGEEGQLPALHGEGLPPHQEAGERALGEQQQAVPSLPLEQVAAARLAGERWKPVKASRLLGVPRGYEASTLGRARSVPRTLANGRHVGGKVLTPWLDDGYPMIRMGRRNIRLATAVQLAFAGPPEVLHGNGDRLDSRPANLRWGSRVENEGDKKRERRIDTEGASPRGELGHLRQRSSADG